MNKYQNRKKIDYTSTKYTDRVETKISQRENQALKYVATIQSLSKRDVIRWAISEFLDHHNYEFGIDKWLYEQEKKEPQQSEVINGNYEGLQRDLCRCGCPYYVGFNEIRHGLTTNREPCNA